MKHKGKSKTELLGAAVFLTILVPIWIFIAVFRWSNPDLRNSTLILIIILAAVCTVGCVTCWYRYATFDKKSKTNDITGGNDHE